MTSCRGVTRVTSGSSVSSGKVRMRATAWSMSWNAFMRSVPVTSSIATEPKPSRAIEVISLIPATPRIADSTGRRMPCSTSAGAAPG